MADGTTGFPAGLAQAIAAQADAFAHALARAHRGEARGVHRARTTSRRLRELLAVAAAARPDAGAARARRDVRRLTRALGRVRELDVSLAELTCAAQTHGWPPAAVARLERNLSAAREERLAGLRRKLDAIDAAGLRERLRAIADGVRSEPLPHLGERELGRRVRRLALDVQRALDKAGTVYIPSELHAVRISAKKLRYALEIAREAGGLAVGRMIGALRRTQDLLGRLHDLQVLEAHVLDVEATRPSRIAGREERAIATALERDARAVHAAFLLKRAALARLARRAELEVAPELMGGRPRALRAAARADAPARPELRPHRTGRTARS